MLEINLLQQKYLFNFLPKFTSFFIRLRQSGEIWLFNCLEGCQHDLVKKKVKISQIKKIIITNNHINNVSGLLGLLSSISLNTKTTNIDLYGSISLYKYIFWGRKYSQTNFRYKLYFHTNLEGALSSQINLHIYSFKRLNMKSQTNYVLLLSQRSGSFHSINAINYQIPSGSLYGELKRGKSFILPDGFITCNKNFVHGYSLGAKIIFLNRSMNKDFFKILNNNTLLLYY